MSFFTVANTIFQQTCNSTYDACQKKFSNFQSVKSIAEAIFAKVDYLFKENVHCDNSSAADFTRLEGQKAAIQQWNCHNNYQGLEIAGDKSTVRITMYDFDNLENVKGQIVEFTKNLGDAFQIEGKQFENGIAETKYTYHEATGTETFTCGEGHISQIYKSGLELFDHFQSEAVCQEKSVWDLAAPITKCAIGAFSTLFFGYRTVKELVKFTKPRTVEREKLKIKFSAIPNAKNMIVSPRIYSVKEFSPGYRPVPNYPSKAKVIAYALGTLFSATMTWTTYLNEISNFYFTNKGQLVQVK